jgi:hypothetical protein
MSSDYIDSIEYMVKFTEECMKIAPSWYITNTSTKTPNVSSSMYLQYPQYHHYSTTTNSSRYEQFYGEGANSCSSGISSRAYNTEGEERSFASGIRRGVRGVPF